MKKSMFVLLVVAVLGALVLSACGGGAAPASSGSKRPAAPAEFASKTNPLAGNADALAKGKEQFTALCQACHGEKGLGDGPAGAALTPKPGNLQTAAKEASDGYLYWRVSEGGSMDPFKSSMPAQKGTLKEEQIWQVISYLKTLK
jgi:mono/diheme cytochrome c family protein